MNLSRIAVAAFFSWCLLALNANACVGCRTQGDTLGNPEQIIQAGLAFSWSVLFMLVVVMSIVSWLVWFLIRTCRAVDSRHSAGPQHIDFK
jgi:heme/copper-type cytochrome/quinol oxidase subunit 2